MIKVLTMCRVGLSRSLAMTDVLKFHFWPVDVVPVGLSRNSPETLRMLVDWADHVILMREKFHKELVELIGPVTEGKIKICEVGADVHGYVGEGRAHLINACWAWLRDNYQTLGIKPVGS